MRRFFKCARNDRFVSSERVACGFVPSRGLLIALSAERNIVRSHGLEDAIVRGTKFVSGSADHSVIVALVPPTFLLTKSCSAGLNAINALSLGGFTNQVGWSASMIVRRNDSHEIVGAAVKAVGVEGQTRYSGCRSPKTLSTSNFSAK